jgi:hypothetical protein
MDLRERVFAALNARLLVADVESVKEDDPALIACDLLALQQFENLRDDEQVELQDYIVEWQESFQS